MNPKTLEFVGLLFQLILGYLNPLFALPEFFLLLPELCNLKPQFLDEFVQLLVFGFCFFSAGCRQPGQKCLLPG